MAIGVTVQRAIAFIGIITVSALENFFECRSARWYCQHSCRFYCSRQWHSRKIMTLLRQATVLIMF